METLHVKDFLNGEQLDKKSLSSQLTVLKHKSGIYIIESNLDGRKYIGSSKNLFDRIKSHIYALNNKKHKNINFNNFVKKYGLSSLEISVIIYDNYPYLEEIYLSYLNNEDFCINRNYSGGDILTDHPFRKEIIKSISLASKKMHEDPIYAQNISERNRHDKNPRYIDGRSYPKCKWPKKDLSGNNNPFYGKKHTEETRKLFLRKIRVDRVLLKAK